MDNNWTEIIKETEGLLDKTFIYEDGKEYVLFGIIHGSDDYCYGFIDENYKLHMFSCVIDLWGHGFILKEEFEKKDQNGLDDLERKEVIEKLKNLQPKIDEEYLYLIPREKELREADDVLCNVLEKLGYRDIVEEYYKI